MTDRKAARDLADGDLIDLVRHYAAVGGSALDIAEYELARVGDEEGPHVWEPDGTFRLFTTQGSFPMDPDTVFDVQGVDR